MNALLWILQGMWSGITGPIYVVTHLGSVFDFSNKENLMRFIYYGASVEFFFFFFDLFLILFIIGLFRRNFLWGVVRVLEGFANIVGRTAAWAGLLMVLQQVMVVFLQGIFRVAEISVGPAGMAFVQPVGWYSDSLKFYNAIVVTMCCAYTFAQGGHVRVDLFYAGFSHRAKRVVDMMGSVLFIMPAMILTWFYSWFFFWRHMITPPVNASDPLERLALKARAVRWNIETTAFSPNGFNAYFLFKVLILVFCAMMLIHAASFFYRSWLEYLEGPESDGKFVDKDVLGDPEAELVAEIH